jgi:hypothetical protein
MTKVAIVPIPTEKGGVSYRAVAGDKRSQGATAGAALDALTAQLTEEESRTLVVVQSGRPDRFFDASQQQRLAELMTHFRSAQDQGQVLAVGEQAELEALIEAELRASGARAAAMADELGR